MKGVMPLSMRKEKVERGLADSKERGIIVCAEKNIYGKIY